MVTKTAPTTVARGRATGNLESDSECCGTPRMHYPSTKPEPESVVPVRDAKAGFTEPDASADSLERREDGCGCDSGEDCCGCGNGCR